MNFTKNITLVLVALIGMLNIQSCSDSVKPQVTTTLEELSTKQEIIDTSYLAIQDLPVEVDSSDILIHPIRRVRKVEDETSTGRISKSRDDYSSRSYRNNGPYSNLFFENLKDQSIQALTTDKIIIKSYEYIHKAPQLGRKRPIFYLIKSKDTNKDKKLDYNDLNTYYISDENGSNFTQLSPDLEKLQGYKHIKRNNHLYFSTLVDVNSDGIYDDKDVLKFYKVDLNKDTFTAVSYTIR